MTVNDSHVCHRQTLLAVAGAAKLKAAGDMHKRDLMPGTLPSCLIEAEYQLLYLHEPACY